MSRDARKAHRSAVIDAILNILFSLTILGGGWLYPGYLLRNDPDIRSDPDFRAGIVLPISCMLGLIYASRAVRSGVRAARTLHPEHPLKPKTPADTA